MNAFLKSIKILLLILVAVVHVHLNMFTVENPLNPSFWVLLFLESPPELCFNFIIEDCLIIAIQCVVTTLFAIYLLKWKKTSAWLTSYLLCILVFLAIRQMVNIPFDNAINQVYDRIYEYGGALNRCITFSIIQIVYIIVYMLITSIASRKAKTDGCP